ncbi:MAG: hypothetical protein ACRDRH_13905 [Pseudonocardia sp.]
MIFDQPRQDAGLTRAGMPAHQDTVAVERDRARVNGSPAAGFTCTHDELPDDSNTYGRRYVFLISDDRDVVSPDCDHVILSALWYQYSMVFGGPHLIPLVRVAAADLSRR